MKKLQKQIKKDSGVGAAKRKKPKPASIPRSRPRPVSRPRRQLTDPEIQRRILGILGGRSRDALARKLGWHTSYISYVLRGERQLSLLGLERLGTELGIDFTTLHFQLKAIKALRDKVATGLPDTLDLPAPLPPRSTSTTTLSPTTSAT